MDSPIKREMEEAQRLHDSAMNDKDYVARRIAWKVAMGLPTGGKRGKLAREFIDANDRTEITRAILDEVLAERWPDIWKPRLVTDELHRDHARRDSGSERTP